MALGNSNTFQLPSAGTSYATARTHVNNSLRATMQNFYSDSAPTLAGLNIQSPPGSALSISSDEELNGIGFRSSKTNAFYMWDSVHQKGNPVHGGNWTRVGVGHRVEATLAAADFTTYEIGETFLTVVEAAGAANVRMYAKYDNASGVTDIGLPSAQSVTTAMMQDRAISNVKIAAVTISEHEMASNAVTNAKIGVNTIFADNIEDLQVTRSKLANSERIPTGVVMPYAGTAAPTGWSICDGSAISRTTYANLFSVTSTAFGVGDGSTTFNIPNLSDRLLLGKGSNNSSLGATTAAMSASSTKTSTSVSISAHSNVSTQSVSTGVKDASSVTVIGALNDHSAITVDTVFPTVVLNMIIKL